MKHPQTPRPAGYVARKPRTLNGKIPGGLKGHFRLEVLPADGRKGEVVETPNLIVNGGLDFVKELLLDSVTPTPLSTLTHVAVGSDGTTETPVDTALLAEHARQAFDAYAAGGTGIASVEVTFAAGTFPTTTSIAEAGLFDAGVGGNMLNRATFSAIPLTVTDGLKVTFTLTFANA